MATEFLKATGWLKQKMNTSNSYDGEGRTGTVGFPLSGVEIKITDSKIGDVIVDSEIGVIEIRGPNVFNGYWLMLEKIAHHSRTYEKYYG